VLAVERQPRLQPVELGLELARAKCRLAPDELLHATGALAGDLGVGADELLGAERLP
jgi:hypothetical protein